MSNIFVVNSCSLGWVGWLSKDTANVVGTDLDVTLVSPAWAPGVLDEEVLLSTLSTVSDGKDTVVELGTA